MTLPPRPFTVIGGFLGAGKTTLVNHILRQANGVRYAVLVNDFGALNIDASLIEAHDGQTMALANGCICCSLSDGFINTMLRLMESPERFDHVVVEASGVSEPDRIMDMARLDPMLEPGPIVVLVDAAEIEARLADPKITDVVTAQLRSAGVLALNKIDRVDMTVKDRVRGLLAAHNRQALVLECTNANLPLDVLFGAPIPAAEQTPHSHSHAEEVFQSLTLVSDRPIDRIDFERFAAALPDHVIRGKGLLVFADMPDKTYAWQRTGAAAEFTLRRGQSIDNCSLLLIATGDIRGCIDPAMASGLAVK